MIIHTKYRDIPAEVAKECVNAPADFDPTYWENNQRGQAIEIHVPAMPSNSKCNLVCEGPIFKTTAKHPDPKCYIAVCPHVAEIGD